MHINRARGPVGGWTFTDTSVEFEKVDRRALDAWVATAARVAAPLEEARLLLPRERRSSTDIERQRGFRAPTAIHVLGSGDVVDEEERPRAVEDLVWLNATLLLNPMVAVCAQSDVWMPFDLRGRPHTALYARNAARLEAALQAVAGLGLETSFDDETPYARIEGFRLDNHHDGDRRAADVVVDDSAILHDE